jgi:hypothetical protein
MGAGRVRTTGIGAGPGGIDGAIREKIELPGILELPLGRTFILGQARQCHVHQATVRLLVTKDQIAAIHPLRAISSITLMTWVKRK